MEKNYIIISISFGLIVFFSFLIKFILSSNDYTVKPFSLSFSEVGELFKLAAISINKGKKIILYLVGLLDILSFIGLIIGSILFLIPNDDDVCKAYAEFKNYQYDYVIINKYIDSTQHSYRTLILRDKKGNQFSSTDLDFDQSGLFNFLSIGDSIIKKAGTGLVTVINRTLDTTIAVNFGCDKN